MDEAPLENNLRLPAERSRVYSLLRARARPRIYRYRRSLIAPAKSELGDAFREISNPEIKAADPGFKQPLPYFKVRLLSQKRLVNYEAHVAHMIKLYRDRVSHQWT